MESDRCLTHPPTAVQPSSELLGPWQGFAVFCVWWIVLLAIAAVMFRRRDA